MILFKKWITKALISLHGCPGWSAPLLFLIPRRQDFSRRGPDAAAYKIYRLRTLWFQIIFFFVFHYICQCRTYDTCDPRGMGNFWPQNHYLNIISKVALNDVTCTKYQGSRPRGFRKAHFLCFFSNKHIEHVEGPPAYIQCCFHWKIIPAQCFYQVFFLLFWSVHGKFVSIFTLR